MEVTIILFIVVLFISCGSLVLSILTFSKKDSFGDDKSGAPPPTTLCGDFCGQGCYLNHGQYCRCGAGKDPENVHQTSTGALRGICKPWVGGRSDSNIKCLHSGKGHLVKTRDGIPGPGWPGGHNGYTCQ